MQFIALALVFLVSKAVARQSDYCYAQDDNPYLNMATKSSYHFIHGTRSYFQTIPGCHPVQVWMIIRHGARYPRNESVEKLRDLTKIRDKIVHNHEFRQNGHLCEEDLNNLKLWNPNPNLTTEMAHRLTPQGIEDTMLLARRLQSNFPELLQPYIADITSENFKFRSTNSERTRVSMEAFMQGLFGSKNAVNPIEAPPEKDILLKAYKNCTAWQTGFKNDPSSLMEVDKFLGGPEVAQLIQNISDRLGFQYAISIESILTMYDMCRYEKAWIISQTSVWCAVFTKDELRILEYSEDIYYNYGAGNGRKVNARMGCPPLQDMFNHFKQLERGDVSGQPRGIFYFSHVITILSLLTSMGIATDPESLLATNYQQMFNREFKTSFIGPFNANLAAVFYRCDNPSEQNKVMFYLQEKPLRIDGCQGGLCDWEYLKNKLGSVAFDCDLNFCWDGSGVSANRAWSIIGVSLPAIILVLVSRFSFNEVE